jgi:hypothetical protein
MLQGYVKNRISKKIQVFSNMRRSIMVKLSFFVVCGSMSISVLHAQEPSLSDTLNWLGDELIGRGLIHGYGYEDCAIAIDNYNSTRSWLYIEKPTSLTVENLAELSIDVPSDGGLGLISHFSMTPALWFDLDAFVIELTDIDKVSSKIVEFKEPFLGARNYAVIELHNANKDFKANHSFSHFSKGRPLNEWDERSEYETVVYNPKIWFAVSLNRVNKIEKALNHAIQLCNELAKEDLF